MTDDQASIARSARLNLVDALHDLHSLGDQVDLRFALLAHEVEALLKALDETMAQVSPGWRRWPSSPLHQGQGRP